MKRSASLIPLICSVLVTQAAYAGSETPVDVPRPDPVTEAWRWQFFTEADGLVSVRVVDVAAQDSAVWFATDRGLSRYDGVSWTSYTEDDGLPDADVRAIALGQDGTVWAGTASGIARLDTAKWVSLGGPRVLSGRAVNDLVVDAEGGLWAATDTCAARWIGGEWQVYTDVDALPDHRVNGLALAPDGAVWFATERGAARYDGSTWRSYHQGKGLLGPSVTSVFVSRDGAAWFSQYGVGLSRLHNGRWSAFSEADGLPDAHVRQVVQSGDGSIWALCLSGIAQSQAAGSPSSRAWTAYTRRSLPGLGEPLAAGVDPKGGSGLAAGAQEVLHDSTTWEPAGRSIIWAASQDPPTWAASARRATAPSGSAPTGALWATVMVGGSMLFTWTELSEASTRMGKAPCSCSAATGRGARCIVWDATAPHQCARASGARRSVRSAGRKTGSCGPGLAGLAGGCFGVVKGPSRGSPSRRMD
ncbi:MAG: hypothetical protein QGI83_22190 [Candidatus Latescibacteria bacterium]|jgi:hypothetical protein|nr:hypothetical protein [Candidatus Latescibacterota bacterium]